MFYRFLSLFYFGRTVTLNGMAHFNESWY